MSISVNIVKGIDSSCDEFVASMPDGKIAHLSRWSDAVAQAAGLNNFYLMAIDNEQICGVLPLIQSKSRMFGNFMVSQAFSDYGGPLAKDAETLNALYERAVEIATNLDCKTVEFRNVEPMDYDLVPRGGKMVMYLKLGKDPELIWKSFKAKVRNQVRKAQKSGITVCKGQIELLDQFYPVYTRRMSELGTPCYSKKLMCSLLTAFPDNSRLFIAKLKDLPVGGGLTFCFNRFVEIPFASTLTRYNRLCPNNLLYWTIIEYYCLDGAEQFDFGRCTVGSSTHQFKKQWGPKPVDLNYQYWICSGHKLEVLSPDNPKYQRRIKIWQKLPLRLTRIAGPYISKNLP